MPQIKVNCRTIVFLYFLFSSFAFAQEKPVPSPPAEAELVAALIEAKTDEERAVLWSGKKDLMNKIFFNAFAAAGNKRMGQGELGEAMRIFRIMRSAAEQKGDKGFLAGAVCSIGNVCFYRQEYDAAKEHYLKSLALAEEGGNRWISGLAASSTARVYETKGDYTQALEYFAKALVVFEEMGDKAKAADMLADIATAHYFQGNYTLALESVQKALSIAEAAEAKLSVAYSLDMIGNVLAAQGNYESALEHHMKCLKLCKELDDQNFIAQTLHNIGNTYRLKGDYSLALQFTEKSFALKEKLGNKISIALAAANIGRVHYAQRNLDLALDYFQKALKLNEGVEYKNITSDMLSEMGNVYALKGDYEKALDNFQKSLAVSESTGYKQSIEDALANIGQIHELRKNYTTAMEYCKRSLALSEEMGDGYRIAQRRVNASRIALMQGNGKEAAELAERAAEQAERMDDRNVLWQARCAAGKAYRALKEFDRASDAFERSIEAVEALRNRIAGGEQEQQRFFENKVEPYYQIVELMIAQNRYGDALGYAERAKARALLDALRGGRANITKAMTAQERERENRLGVEIISLNTQLLRENLRPNPDQTRLADLKSRLNKVRLGNEAFQTSLYAAHPELKIQRGEAPPFTIEEAAELLPDAKTALLEYVASDEKIWLFALIRNASMRSGVELKVYELEISPEEAARLAEKFRAQLASRDLGFRESGASLYKILIKPAQALLQGRTKLVIAPDRALWELPFQALLSGDNRYLLEERAVSYAPSLTVLREMARLRRKGTEQAGDLEELLAFGNPSLGEQTALRIKSAYRDAKLYPLPEAEKEVLSLGRLYGASQSKIYTGAEAREERVKSDAGRCRVLHLATHGILNDASPMYSYVVMSQSEKAENEDGLLEAWELMRMELKADIAILSACETARGRVTAGEGMIGLAWALFVAGCPTTVVSQWKVDSASTTELMLEFHRNLKQEAKDRKADETKSEALREAALKLMRNPAYKHPFYWAGFIMIGDGF